MVSNHGLIEGGAEYRCSGSHPSSVVLSHGRHLLGELAEYPNFTTR